MPVARKPTRRRQTDYHTLLNRCQECAHRLSMHDEKRCNVVMNPTVYRQPEHDVACGCKAL